VNKRGAKIKLEIRFDALIFAASVFYFAPFDFVAAYFFAVLFHETGHVICLLLLKKRMYKLKIELKGLVLEHEGALTPLQELLCAASGPALGVIYAYVASFTSTLIFSDFFCLSAGISLTLSFFNALPVMPLDGATMLNSLCILLGNRNPGNVLYVSGILVCICLFLIGVYLISRGAGYGLTAMSIILLLYTLFEEGIVKTSDLR